MCRRSRLSRRLRRQFRVRLWRRDLAHRRHIAAAGTGHARRRALRPSAGCCVRIDEERQGGNHPNAGRVALESHAAELARQDFLSQRGIAMKVLIAIVLLLCFLFECACAAVSGTACEVRGAVARAAARSRGAHHRTEDFRGPGQPVVIENREVRAARSARPSRQVGCRWLHHRHWLHAAHHRPESLQDLALRHSHGLRAGVAGSDAAAKSPGASCGAGELGEGTHCARQGEPGEAQLRVRRQRHWHAPLRELLKSLCRGSTWCTFRTTARLRAKCRAGGAGDVRVSTNAAHHWPRTGRKVRCCGDQQGAIAAVATDADA